MSDQRPLTRYERNKRWRHRNPDGWNAWKTRWRRRTGSDGQVGGYRRRWSGEEDAMVLAHDRTDRELAVLIDRSVTAIQMRRHRLRGGEA